ncbi:MAG: RtcB family protein [Gemmatimonadota bacterium]
MPPAQIQRRSPTLWELPTSYRPGMRVPARIVANDKLLEAMDEGVFEQVANVAALPGIVGAAYCMPDGHWGYGFPIGGVAAIDPADGGVISPGGIGFDVNCGMRLVRTDLQWDEVRPRLRELVDGLFERVPAGVGEKGLIRLGASEFCRAVEGGAAWAVARGFGWPADLARTEEEGCIAGADAGKVSRKAIERGLGQIGTLGSGNHYLEIQVVDAGNIRDAALAGALGVGEPGQVVVMFHCGSRGFGHQVATDYLRSFLEVMDRKYGIQVRDRELACAPFDSPEGQDYFAAMKCAINMSFAGRQVILHRIREVFSGVLGRSAEAMGMHLVYDVSHNTAKLEEHEVEGRRRRLLVHRKGATRAFAPGHPDLPADLRPFGQPVIIGGSMETGSYLLVGTEGGRDTFQTTAHGSGRTMSRRAATKRFDGRQLQRDMEARGTYVRTTSLRGLAEEAGAAYKDIDEVVAVTEAAGISRPVVRFRPVGNVKG